MDLLRFSLKSFCTLMACLTSLIVIDISYICGLNFHQFGLYFLFTICYLCLFFFLLSIELNFLSSPFIPIGSKATNYISILLEVPLTLKPYIVIYIF